MPHALRYRPRRETRIVTRHAPFSTPSPNMSRCGALAELLDDHPPGVRRLPDPASSARYSWASSLKPTPRALKLEEADGTITRRSLMRSATRQHSSGPDPPNTARAVSAGFQPRRPSTNDDLRREPVGEGLDHCGRAGARALKAERLGDALFDRLGGELRAQRDGAGREALAIEIADDQCSIRQRGFVATAAEARRTGQRPGALWTDAHLSTLDPE